MSGTVSSRVYVSRAYHERELKLLWPRVWMLVGHESEVASAGAWFVFDLARDSIVVARGDDGVVRAFHNVCQHRGMTLCAAPRGHSATLRCPYHQWVWGLDGSLRAARGGAPAGVRLADVRCEVRHGFVFINLDAGAAPLADFLGEIDDRLSRFRPSEFRLRGDRTIEIACNWKTSADASNESYHLPMLHPELSQVADLENVLVELLGFHGSIRVPLGAPRAPGAALLDDMLARAGVRGQPRTLQEVRAALGDAARERLDREGLAPLSEDQLVDKHQLFLFPNVQLNFLPFSLELYRHRPDADDPSRCFFDEQSFDRRPLGVASKAPPKERFRHGDRPLGPVMGKDVDVLPALQRGMSSAGFRGPHWMPGEEPIANMHRGLAHYLGEPAHDL